MRAMGILDRLAPFDDPDRWDARGEDIDPDDYDGFDEHDGYLSSLRGGMTRPGEGLNKQAKKKRTDS